MGAPTPSEVDRKAAQFYALKEKLRDVANAYAEVEIPLDHLKKDLIELVSDFGSAHAEKSRLLHGITSEMMVTFGQSVSIDAAAVERFRLALVQASQARLLKRVFEKDIRWTLSTDAGAIIKGEKLSRPLLALYAQCQVVKQKAPSLFVREKSA
jgi:hypothetical protein